MRKQTLLGIAPVIPERPAAEPKPAAAPTTEAASSVSSIVTPAAVATDAPTTTEVAAEVPARAAPRRAASQSTPSATLSSSDHDVPELKPRRPRWLVALGVAAAIGLGVVGLRSLDRPPAATPEALARPITKAKPPAKASGELRPKSDGDDDDDANDPNAGNDPTPAPTPPDPDPLKAAPVTTASPAASAPAPTPVTTPAPAASAAAAPTPAPTPGAVGALQIHVSSDPPGARMFWKGKEVGTTPFVLEFPSGERHAYEVGLPGYTTRKVVIDGTKTEITIGLRPDQDAPLGATR